MWPRTAVQAAKPESDPIKYEWKKYTVSVDEVNPKPEWYTLAEEEKKMRVYEYIIVELNEGTPLAVVLGPLTLVAESDNAAYAQIGAAHPEALKVDNTNKLYNKVYLRPFVK
jgi:hypothetical protein